MFYVFFLQRPYTFTPLLHSRPVIFGLTFFGSHISIHCFFPYGNIIFDLCLFDCQENNYDIKQSFDISIEWSFSKRQGVLCEV